MNLAGLLPSRRGDLEILSFNLIHWLARTQPGAVQKVSTGLPWGPLTDRLSLRGVGTLSNQEKSQIADSKERTMLTDGSVRQFVLQAGIGANESKSPVGWLVS